MKGRINRAPKSLNAAFPKGTRRPSGPSAMVAIMGGMVPPILAPTTSANVASIGTAPLLAIDIINKTTAKLEWANHVSKAAIKIAISASPEIEISTSCRT